MDIASFAILLILVGTMLNGLFVSLCYEYAPNPSDQSNFVRGTFLSNPDDIHADMIEVALAYPPFTKINTSSWPYPYDRFALENYYHSFDLTQQPPVDVSTWSAPPEVRPGEHWVDRSPASVTPPQPGTELSILHLTPLMAVIGMVTKRTLIFCGLRVTMLLYYGIATLGLAATCAVILQNWPSTLWAFTTLFFSFPFLCVLTRGNQGSLTTGISLILFIFLVCKTERHILAAVLFALAVNIRPNALVLAPLLFCFGPRRFVTSALVFVFAASAFFCVAYKIDQILYPGYNLTVFREAVHHYYVMYVVEYLGNAGNNSAFGAFKLIYLYLGHTHGWLHPRLFDLVNRMLAVSFALFAIWGWILFGYNKLSRFEFAYVCVAVYVLASSVFGTYHLIVFAIFPLLLCRDRNSRRFDLLDLVILFSSVFVLIPKVYFLVRSVSPDAVLNPVVLLITSFLVLAQRSGLDFASLARRLRLPWNQHDEPKPAPALMPAP